MRRIVLQRFGDTASSKKIRPSPPVRGPFGEAKNSLVEAAIPLSRPSYLIGGERMETHKLLLDEVIASGMVETRSGPWNVPAFIVPEKA